MVREVEFVRNLNYVFYRIALTGVAAIVIAAYLDLSDGRISSRLIHSLDWAIVMMKVLFVF